MDFENLNILPLHNVLADVDRIVVILAEEGNRNVDMSLNRTVQNMYNKHIRLYNQANPDKRKAIQEKYRASHPKTEEQKAIDKAYAKAYYLKKKEEQRIRNLLN